MKISKSIMFLTILTITFLSFACSSVKNCPPGTTWDSVRKVCVQTPRTFSICPDDSMVDLDLAVGKSIECVKADPQMFDRTFAQLIQIAKKSPDIDNGERILRLVKAVAIDAPYVPSKKAKMKWNRYFSPHFFVSMGYRYESIKNYCAKKEEIKREISDELSHKRIGIIDCMTSLNNKSETAILYRQAEDTALSLKKGLDAACKACCDARGLIRK